MRYDRQYKVFSMKKHFIVEGNGFMNLGAYLQNIYNRKKNQTLSQLSLRNMDLLNGLAYRGGVVHPWHQTA